LAVATTEPQVVPVSEKQGWSAAQKKAQAKRMKEYWKKRKSAEEK
jgi:hypothetical protein